MNLITNVRSDVFVAVYILSKLLTCTPGFPILPGFPASPFIPGNPCA